MNELKKRSNIWTDLERHAASILNQNNSLLGSLKGPLGNKANLVKWDEIVFKINSFAGTGIYITVEEARKVKQNSKQTGKSVVTEQSSLSEVNIPVKIICGYAKACGCQPGEDVTENSHNAPLEQQIQENYYKHLIRTSMPVLLRTHYATLSWVLKFKKNTTVQVARWLRELRTYNLTVTHRSGTQHRKAEITNGEDMADEGVSEVQCSKKQLSAVRIVTRPQYHGRTQTKPQTQTFLD
ncbi:LOW QUALITY PROTEIN: hypothetical protein MAR_034887 [Mya arenaria]|uniref:Uncharacterized protein n=1 Tax=Mya arenaria TaxID=6604 RepID=A0ABY7ELY8_MYAAR|nr:LOW QUALITY PROTEIN: hypothetical protein MAR_034887 [Mya arenaria]